MKKKSIWKRSWAELHQPRALVVASVLMALQLAMDFMGLKIYITPETRISVGFVCSAAVAMFYGPVVGMMTGFTSDVLGFLLSPNNNAGYFPGYTLTAVVAGLLYGVWLYKERPTFLRCLGAKVSVNLICNILLNSLWSMLVYQKGLWILLPGKLLKNLILLPFEVVLLWIVANIVLRQFRRVFSQSVNS